MTRARQWWVFVRYKDEPGSGFCKQYVTATNAYEAIQMAKALYGKLLMSEGAFPIQAHIPKLLALAQRPFIKPLDKLQFR